MECVHMISDDPAAIERLIRSHPSVLRNALNQLNGIIDLQLWSVIGAIGTYSTEAMKKLLAADDKKAVADEMARRCSSAEREIVSRGQLSDTFVKMFMAAVCWIEDDDFGKTVVSQNGLLWRISALARLPQARSLGTEVFEIFTDAVHNCMLKQKCLNESLQVLADSGGLEMLFTILSLHPDHEANVKSASRIFKSLIDLDPGVLRQSLKEGKPCRDALDRAVASTAGSQRSDAAHVELCRLRSVVELLRPTDAGRVMRMCRTCHKQDKAGLLACSRCKTVYYCSRECQKSDWKNHKQTCGLSQGENTSDPNSVKAHQALIMSFMEQHFTEIIKRMRAMRTRGSPPVDIQDMVTWIDRSTGSFGVEHFADLMEGKNLPSDWIYPGTEVFERNLAGLKTSLSSLRAILQPGMVLCMERPATGGMNVVRVALQARDGRENLFTNAVLDDPAVQCRLMLKLWTPPS